MPVRKVNYSVEDARGMMAQAKKKRPAARKSGRMAV